MTKQLMIKRFAALLFLTLTLNTGFAQSVPVSVERLGDLLVARELRASASVISANRSVVTSEETALIEAILVDVGAAVKKGDVLVRLDNDNATLALAQARAILDALDARIEQALWRLAKSEDLLKKSFVSDDELIGRNTDVAVLQANRQGQLVAIQAAELALARTRIRAPFNATVVQRQAQVGNFAQPGTQLMTLVQTDNREIDAELDPRYAISIPSVSKLRYVSLGREFPVKLLRLSDVIETDTRKLRARFGFTDNEAPIGSSGEIAWTEISGVVPVTLIVQRGSVFGVFTAQNNRAVFVEIPDAQEGRPAALDLPDDSMIVTRGHVRLQDGDELLISNE
jgi:RND family efflux transporter MFP subunit